MYPSVRSFSVAITLALVVSVNSLEMLWAQAPKPRRARAPKFTEQSFPGVFFDDVKSQLVGSLPAVGPASAPTATAQQPTEAPAANSDENIWKRRIDAATIEDLVKSAKTRLDPAVSSPAKFVGGGYQTARRDFTILTVLFGVIEQYPGDVRWKHSAGRAKTDFARIAANAKVGSPPVYNEAKLKNQMFGDLLNGERLEASKDNTDSWLDVADRVALMQVLEWIVKENLNAAVANSGALTDGATNAREYAQLAGVIGQVLVQKDMPDADADEYKQWATEMMAACDQIVAGANKPDLAQTREAISRLDKSCNSCHETFR
jgi:hypothetical protein